MTHIKKLIRPVRVLSWAGMFLFMFFTIAGCRNNSTSDSHLLFERPTELLAMPDHRSATGNMVITVVPAGGKAIVINTLESKCPIFYKVRLNDGRTGYVIHDQGTKIIKNP